MAKKNAKLEAAVGAAVIVIGVPVLLLTKLVDAVGWVVPLVVVIGSVGLVFLYQWNKKKLRFNSLRAKYQDEVVVRRIVSGSLWEGQSEDQLRDSMGEPLVVDRSVLKTKTKEVWKYRQQGANRYGLKVTVENGKVIGWEQKA